MKLSELNSIPKNAQKNLSVFYFPYSVRTKIVHETYQEEHPR